MCRGEYPPLGASGFPRPLPEEEQMKRSTLALAVVAVLALGLATACGSRSTGRTITVSGDATVKAKPNLVNLTFTTDTKGSSAPRALAANSRAMARVIAAIKRQGVAPRDIQTQQVSVSSITDSRGNTTGYSASNSVSVNLHDVAKTGILITTATGAGSVLESGPTFSQENTDLTYQQALDKALDQARGKAAAMAEHSGLHLGKPVSIKEGSENVTPLYRSFDMATAKLTPAPVPIQPGRIEVSATVTVVYSVS
jgi:uncharacterized protein YggE